MLKFSDDQEIKNLTEVGLGPFAEWQTPPCILSLTVTSAKQVMVAVDDPLEGREGPRPETWAFNQTVAETHIPGILNHLKRFRESQSDYLENVTTDFCTDLEQYHPQSHWDNHDPGFVSRDHLEAWNQSVRHDQRLWELAKSSYLLYNAVFPRRSWLRETLDALKPGTMIDITWLNDYDGHVANVPWGLLYCEEPRNGAPIDATKFWALRFRVDYQSYIISGRKSPALGSPNYSKVGHAYYWVGPHGDRTLAEANWQRERLETLPSHVSMPTDKQNPKQQLIKWLAEPWPPPMPVLYMYCRAKVDDNSQLEFGHNILERANVTIQVLELPGDPFKDVRFVFCNACESGQKQPGQAINLLESHFFDRGCSAFLGTVHETPIGLASRFAVTFFHFFYGRVDGRIISAGEAVVQARRFLWLKYRNIGGLFFNYVNEYDLYFADLAELKQHRHDISGTGQGRS
jgi:hypothetical protein